MTTPPVSGPPIFGRRRLLFARWLFLTLAVVGTTAFADQVLYGDSMRAWQSLLVNFLFFAGLAQAGVVLSALLQVTSARWGRPLKRLSEATVAFLPVAALLLIVLLSGTATWAPWVHEPIPEKTPWLNVTFFVTRQLVSFGLLSLLSVLFVYRSLRPDIGMLVEAGEQPASRVTRWLIAGWKGSVKERSRSQEAQTRLAPVLLIAYGWVFTLVAFDLVMALEPHWFSTLMGAYYFVGNVFIGVAFVTVVGVWAKDRLGLQDYIGPQQMHDIGKLLFGFSILWAYMVWSQYLVIWYGDLPEETTFVYHRMHGMWAPVTWTVVVLAFALPFTVLLSRSVKTQPGGLTRIAVVVLTGMWLERFLLVSPSLWHGEGLPLGIFEIMVAAGTLGLFGLCYTTFLVTFPVLPLSDPRLTTITEHWLPEPGSHDETLA
jgi:Ni/Fe-hydrogenase subunit HybB-like protein